MSFGDNSRDIDDLIDRVSDRSERGAWKAGAECVYVDVGHAAGDPDAPDTRIVSCSDATAALIVRMREALIDIIAHPDADGHAHVSRALEAFGKASIS